jgi:signal transduction histidine kinase
MKTVVFSVFQKSLLRRNFVGHFAVLFLFCVLASGNLIFQSAKETNTAHSVWAETMAKSTSSLLGGLERTPVQSEFGMLNSMLTILDQSFLAMISNPPDNNRKVLIRISDLKGEVLFTSTAATNFPFNRTNKTQYKVVSNGSKWLVGSFQGKDSRFIVELAAMQWEHDVGTSDSLWSYVALPFFVFLPLAALITWLTTIRGLSPIKDLARKISERSPTDMTHLKLDQDYPEFRPVALEINSLLTKLEQTLKRERAFLADAAHELRTPLAVVQAQAHVLQYAQTNAERQQAADELATGVERTASLIRKLLVSARLNADSFSPTLAKANLVELIQQRISSFSILAEKKSIEMELDSPTQCQVRLDRESFVSAIDNVIDNAINHSPIGARIGIQILTLKEGFIHLRVTDQGPGIPEQFREQAFERFFRVPGNDQHGNGLGLAIVKRVMALHNGQVLLDKANNNNGLCVDLVLPKA